MLPSLASRAQAGDKQATQSLTETSKGAKQEVMVEVNDFTIRVTHQNLRCFAGIPHWYANVDRWRKCLHWRPVKSKVVGRARPWWRYAIKCVMAANENDMASHMRLVTQSKEYVGLFKRGCERPWLEPLSDSETTRLAELEEELPLNMLLKTRMRAMHSLEHEEKSREHTGRDFTEMQAEIMTVPAKSWEMPNATDIVVNSCWLQYEQNVSKVPSKRLIMVVDVVRFIVTTCSGWALMQTRGIKGDDDKNAWDRLWIRLKGTTLEFYSDSDDPKCNREINIERCSNVTVLSDCVSLGIEGPKMFYQLKFDDIHDCNKWRPQLENCLPGGKRQNPSTYCSQRWLIIYKGVSDAKPVDAIVLSKSRFQIVPPKVLLKKSPFAKIITAMGPDSSVKECLIAGDKAEKLQAWISIIAADATDSLRLDGAGGRLSKAQKAQLQGEHDEHGHDHAEPEPQPEPQSESESETESETVTAPTAPQHYAIRGEFKLRGIRIAAGTHSFDWLSMDLTTLRAVVSSTDYEAHDVRLTLEDLAIHDSYSREEETCYPKLMFCSQLESDEPILNIHATITPPAAGKNKAEKGLYEGHDHKVTPSCSAWAPAALVPAPHSRAVPTTPISAHTPFCVPDWGGAEGPTLTVRCATIIYSALLRTTI